MAVVSACFFTVSTTALFPAGDARVEQLGMASTGELLH